MRALLAAIVTVTMMMSFSIPVFGSDEVFGRVEMTIETEVFDLNQPGGLCLDESGNLLVADTYNHRILRVADSGIEVVAGVTGITDPFGFPLGALIDGPSHSAWFHRPRDLVCDDQGVIYVADTDNHCIRKIQGGKVTTFAGNGEAGFKNGYGPEVRFNKPSGITLSEDGQLYVADMLNNAIRVVNTTTGQVTTLSLADAVEDSNDSRMVEPSDLCFDEEGILYVLDSGMHQIKKVEGGKVIRIAGAGSELDEQGYGQPGFADGLSKEAVFNFPKALTVHEGMIIVADTWNHRLRIIKEDGYTVTLAGNGLVGDGGSLIDSSVLNGPSGVLVNNGILYVSDRWNNSIKSIDLNYGNALFDLHRDYWGETDPFTYAGEDRFNAAIGRDLLSFGDVSPIIHKDHSYFPLRFIAESLGAKVSYDAATRRAKVVYKDKTIDYAIDGEEVLIHKDRSLLPIRSIAGEMGFFLTWMPESRTVVIYEPEKH